jgi:hypothetical protein
MRRSGLKAVTAVIFAVLVFLGGAGASWATTFYVSATGGNDANDGLSSATPWKTISKVNSATFQPGDSILLKSGDLWREQLAPPSSGTSGSVITFGSYSSGAKPVISGADVVNGLPYIVNDTFTGNTMKGWTVGRGTVVATGDHLEAAIDGVDNSYGDYATRDMLAVKEGWLTFRFNLLPGSSWVKDQSIIGSGITDGAYVGLINSNGTPMFRIRVERDGGYDYYLPAAAPVQEGVWNDIKIHVKCASAAGANDGAVDIWINGVQIFSLAGIDNDTKSLKKLTMGNAFYAPTPMTMRLGIDEVKFANRDLTGAETTAWQPTSVSGSDGAAVYRGYAFYDSSTLFENRIAMKKVIWNTDLATTAASMQKGNWTIDTKSWTIYVIPSAGGVPDPGAYEAATRTNCILVNGKNYTRFQGLELKNSDREAFLFMKLSGIEIDSILAHRNGCQGTNLSVVQGQTVTNAFVHDSIFRDSSWNGISVDSYYGPSSGITIANNLSYNNIHNGIDFKASGNYTYSNLTVIGNRSYNNGTHGLYMQNYPQGGAKNATISRNVFYRNFGAGLYVHKYYTAGQDHTGIKIYGNTFAYNGQVGGFGPGVYLDAVDSDIRDNNFYSDSVTASGNSEYRINGTGDSSNYNNSFDRTRPAYLYYNGAAFTFPAFQSQGFETNGISANPKFAGETNDDYTLNWDSPSIDSGVAIPGITTDIVGNPIYGTPDLGAFEYQPPYAMGLYQPDLTGNVRIYADGRFRNTAAPSGNTAKLQVAPSGGFGTGNYAEWMNLVINAWQTSNVYEKSWSESSPTLGSGAAIVHTVGDLQPNSYFDVTVDAVAGAGISGAGCSAGTCLSDSQGSIVFTYSGDYSGGGHIFDVKESGATPSCVALANAVCFPSITQAYQSITGASGTILVRNITLTENLVFDRNVNVTVLGGYIAGFSSRSGTTVVNGSMTNTAGLASFGNVTIK